MKRRVSYALLLALCLSGCQNFTPGKATAAKTSDKGVAGAIASAAQDAAGSGMIKESLLFNEKLYRSDPHNPEYILNYARDLRRAGRTADAKLVIRTPAKGPRATEPLLTECALTLIAAGEYNEALTFAQKAVEKNDKSPDAHQALALALSGLGKYADAQLQFQEAMDLWPEKRDRTSIINNLAMSLAAQGKINEARTVMSLATGEALRSEVYQNNRALLDGLEEPVVKEEKLPPPTTIEIKANAKTDDKKPLAKAAPMAVVKKSVKMQPIVE